MRDILWEFDGWVGSVEHLGEIEEWESLIVIVVCAVLSVLSMFYIEGVQYATELYNNTTDFLVRSA